MTNRQNDDRPSRRRWYALLRRPQRKRRRASVDAAPMAGLNPADSALLIVRQR